MKYYNTIKEEQETLIHVLYEEQIIKIYSSKPETIKCLIDILGQPTVKHKKSKTYWSGATWNIKFWEINKIKDIVNKKIVVDCDFKIKDKKNNFSKEFEQISII